MKKSSEMTGLELLARKFLLSSKKWNSRNSSDVEHYGAEIREINSELVRRAMEYENRNSTLPQFMIDAIRRGDRGNRTRTVTELMDEWNLLGSLRRGSTDAFTIIRSMAILDEIERRVLEVEDFHAKARRGFMERIQAS